MIDVLSEGLGDLGHTFVMNSLLSTDAKKNFLFLTESPADLPSGLSPKHSPGSVAALSDISELSHPCNKLPTQNIARNLNLNVLFEAWIFSFLLITNGD